MASTDFISAGRIVPVVVPESVSAAGTPTSLIVDCKGWKWAVVHLQTGTVAATADGTYTVQMGAASNGSDAADVTGAAFTVEAADDDTRFAGLIDLHRQPRYLKIDGTSGTGGTTLMAANVTLYGCANTAEYIDASSGGPDELTFTILTA